MSAGPKGLQQYIDTVRQGKGQHAKQYSARYICSLVGDFHRTLLYGGEQGVGMGVSLCLELCGGPVCWQAGHLTLTCPANPHLLLYHR